MQPDETDDASSADAEPEVSSVPDAQEVVPEVAQPEPEPETQEAKPHTPPIASESSQGWRWDKTLRLFDALLTFISLVGVLAVLYQLKLTRESMMNDKRAWVTAKGVTMQGELKENGLISAVLEFTNTGASPALQLQHNIRLELLNADSFTLKPPGLGESVSVLGPNIAVFAESLKLGPLTSEHVRRLQAGELHLLLYGTIWYDDIFGTNHTTGFCMAWPSRPRDTANAKWSSCSGGNWAN